MKRCTYTLLVCVELDKILICKWSFQSRVHNSKVHSSYMVSDDRAISSEYG